MHNQKGAMRSADAVLCFDDLTADGCVTCPQGGWTAATVCSALDDLFQRFLPSVEPAAERKVVGHSAEGRAIEEVRIGTGPTVVLAWSQMHGDEQTYTSVALNLLRLLMADQCDWATQFLQACTLHLIPMLNPDGAERNWRFNAHGIDINRDAQALATPEGRVLHERVHALRPAFAFNLHNQNRRRRLPSGNGPIAISLLVPPLDATNSKTPNVTRAEEVAAEITRAVTPACNGRVTRYGADYMWRAFGEWVQSQGASTVLLEAGGWGDQENSPQAIAALERVNLLALASGLVTIARGSIQGADATPYTTLPRAHEHESFDLLIENAVVCFADSTAVMDLGMNDDYPMAAPRPTGEGRVVDVGDLSVHDGLQRIDASSLLCLPGRTGLPTYDGDPRLWLCDTVLEQALGRGLTTLFLHADLEDPEVTKWIAGIMRGPKPPLNIRFCPPTTRHSVMEWDAPLSARDWMHSLAWNAQWTRGARDLVLATPPQDSAGKIESIKTVIIGGTIVLQDGEIIERHAGRWSMMGDSQ